MNIVYFAPAPNPQVEGARPRFEILCRASSHCVRANNPLVARVPAQGLGQLSGRRKENKQQMNRKRGKREMNVIIMNLGVSLRAAGDIR